MPQTYWSESFDYYGTTLAFLTDGLWAVIDGNWALSTEQSRTGTRSLKHTGIGVSGGRRARRTLDGIRNTVGCAFGLYFIALPGTNETMFAFTDASNVQLVTFVYMTDGSIRVHEGDETGTTLGIAELVLAAGTWNHVEVRLVLSAIVGEIEVRVNTITVLHLTDLNLGSTGASSIWWGKNITGFTTSTTHYLDDIIIHDGDGWTGPARVLTVFPAADFSPQDWLVEGAATATDAVDDASPDDDTSYINGAVSGDIASFLMPELPADVEDILSVYIPGRMKQDEAGATTVQMKLLSGSSEEDGGSRPLTTGYQYHPYRFHFDPALSPAGVWTKTSFEAAVLQVIRTE